MTRPAEVCFVVAAAILSVAGFVRPATGQVPARDATPRLAVPAREVTAPAPGQPTTAPTAAAPAEPAPATAAAPTVTAAPIGAAPIGPALQPTSSGAATPTVSATTGFFAGTVFALALEGVQVAPLKSTDGGFATSDVVVEKPGPGNLSAKHLAAVRYEEVTFTASIRSKPLNDWITASWKTNTPPKNGSVASMDYSKNILAEREFSHAFITETTFPALGGLSHADGYITVKVAAESTRPKSGVGGKGASFGPGMQHAWAPGSFRFEMAGLDGSKISHIDPFTVRKTLVDAAVGELRDSQQKPETIEFPNLKITVPAIAAQTWVAWHDDFVVKGKNSPADERSGAIVYLDNTLQNELGRINLSNCGIFRLTSRQEGASANANTNTHSAPPKFLLVAELYCERMDFVGK